MSDAPPSPPEKAEQPTPAAKQDVAERPAPAKALPIPDSADGGKPDGGKPEGKKISTLKELIAMQFFRGPLPSPLMLTKYEEAIPGLGKTLVEWTQQESEHRRKLETRNQLIQILGMGCGFMIGIAGLAAATAMAWKGHGAAAAIVGGVDIAGLVSIFVLGRRLPVPRRDDEDGDQGEGEDDDEDSDTSEFGIVSSRTRTHTSEPPSKG